MSNCSSVLAGRSDSRGTLRSRGLQSHELVCRLTGGGPGAPKGGGLRNRGLNAAELTYVGPQGRTGLADGRLRERLPEIDLGSLARQHEGVRGDDGGSPSVGRRGHQQAKK